MTLIRSQAMGAGVLDPAARQAGGDETARVTAAELHERYLGDVFRYVLRRVPRQEEAEDITAEVFAAATAGLSRFRGQCLPHLWLLGIARRQIAMALRRRKARRETLASELDMEFPGVQPIWEALALTEGPEATVVRAEARSMVRELLALLTPDQREALLLQYGEGLSVAEIAVVLGRSAGAVNSLLHRARATLFHRGQAYFLSQEEGHTR
jgi:RNA polymerase sigma-70 factor (ECF subfamily)